MKFPRLLCSVTLFLLMQLTAVEAQVLTVPKLNSTLGNTATITTCDAGTVTFTATGDSGPTPIDVEFRIDRGGTIIYPLGIGRQSITTFATNTLQDGDIIYAPSVFELYFSFDFSPFRRNNRGVYKRLQIDNY